MSKEFSKRALTGLGAVGLGAGALGLLAPRASADIAFTGFAFQAAGAPVPRTMPDRLSEIKNVKDFGAKGDGSTDDTAAIQAAVNWNSGANRGTIYFPPGRYVVSAPITFNYNGPLSIAFRGEQGLSTLVGNFPGFIIDRGINPQNLTDGGRVVEKMTVINGHAAGGGIRVASSVTCAIRDCNVSAYRGITTVDIARGASQSVVIENCNLKGAGVGNAAGGTGIEVGANGVISACDLNGWDVGIRASGTAGVVIMGCRVEVNNTGVLLGQDFNLTTSYLQGCTILGGTFESNGTAIDGRTLSNFYISNTGISGFEGAIPGNPQYGIRLRTESQFGTLCGISVSGQFQVACISIANTTQRGGIVCSGVRVNNASTLGGVGWQLPTAAHTAEWINCDVRPTFLFSGLPFGANLRPGDTYFITNANTSTLTAAVTGSGSTAGYVTWNGSQWTLMSK